MINHLSQVTQCTFEYWQPGIGNPHFMNWLAVLGYAVVTIIAFRSYIQIKPLNISKSEKVFWITLSSILFLLTLNKLFNLQTFFTAFGRCEAQISGWYQDRKPKQVAMISLWIIIGLISLIASTYLLKNSLKRIWFILIAFWLNIIFILVRAVGFHDVDALLSSFIGWWRVNWVFEHTGIALILIGLWIANSQYTKFTGSNIKEQ